MKLNRTRILTLTFTLGIAFYLIRLLSDDKDITQADQGVPSGHPSLQEEDPNSYSGMLSRLTRKKRLTGNGFVTIDEEDIKFHQTFIAPPRKTVEKLPSTTLQKILLSRVNQSDQKQDPKPHVVANWQEGLFRVEHVNSSKTRNQYFQYIFENQDYYLYAEPGNSDFRQGHGIFKKSGEVFKWDLIGD